MPSGYQPRSETEKALLESLRSMELQCKERVDLLDALRKSRLEAEEAAKTEAETNSFKSRESLPSANKPAANGQSAKWMGGADTAPSSSFSDVPRGPPALPDRRPAGSSRPSYGARRTSGQDLEQTRSLQPPEIPPPVPTKERARTPSPEKKPGGMLKTLRPNTKERSSGKTATMTRARPQPAASQAATQVWSAPQRPNSSDVRMSSDNGPSSGKMWDPYTRALVDKAAEASLHPDNRRVSDNNIVTSRHPIANEFIPPERRSFETPNLSHARTNPLPYPDYPPNRSYNSNPFADFDQGEPVLRPPSPPAPPPPPHQTPPLRPPIPDLPKANLTNISKIDPPSISYMKEFPNHPPIKPKKPSLGAIQRGDTTSDSDGPSGLVPGRTALPKQSPPVPRKSLPKTVSSGSVSAARQRVDGPTATNRLLSELDLESSSPESTPRKTAKRKVENQFIANNAHTPSTTDDSQNSDDSSNSPEKVAWDRKVQHIMKNLPKGVDETAAKQIFNEIVIQGDEVHWDDVAGLDIAKSALKETVVYPFLRPDLFMGLREPARGMLLFGPPGTGKTMLARAVATESKSIFFAISASSLTSKFLGESEKLVRALFALAKALAPSIIFVDEIDSLLGSRGGSSEHEATRRIKTEFLIQWSDLQKAAAGREDKEGDATRVLVLAATNIPWAIDEAARRRFVRRQYIPLPEDWVREQQLRTLLAAQKHNLRDRDLKVLVRLTDNFSGSDITALAKDAAMGPLRSLGEKLLDMRPEQIRGIQMEDFENSLVNIRPSVGRAGLKEYEDWAREFGERGG